jgi:membrane protein required for colicin V production
VNYTFAEKATIDKSLFYNPIQKMAALIYPSVEEWYTEIKVKSYK